MINELPTLFEVVMGAAKQAKEQAAPQINSNKIKSGGRMVSAGLLDLVCSCKHLIVLLYFGCIYHVCYLCFS